MERMKLAGRYEILHLVGGGGMSNVYKAKDLLLDRFVAVKAMNKSLGHESDFIRRFFREAKAAGSLSHANVVNIYDVGQEGDIFYMVMEFVEGPSLIEVIRKEGPLTPEKTVEIASQICDGLSHAHEKGIIHRDIKPHNILVAPGDVYKVTDFGISYYPRASTITQKGYVMGSAHYFSPEQASGGQVSFASDLYSLGIVIYEMLTGRVPFDGESSISVALKHIHDPIPDPRDINPRIPEELCQVIFKALDKDPAKRYQTAQEMKLALEQAMLIANPPQHDYIPLLQSKPRRTWSKKLMGGVAAIFGAVLLFFGYQVIGESKPNNTSTQIEKPVGAGQQNQYRGYYHWWRELPKPKYKENEMFRNIRVQGKDGKYEVSLEVNNDLPTNSIYYDIFVVDDISSRKVLPGVFVPVSKQQGKRYTTVTFHVNVPKSFLPPNHVGIMKIDIYWLKESKGHLIKTNFTDILLQQWGELPKNSNHGKVES